MFRYVLGFILAVVIITAGIVAIVILTTKKHRHRAPWTLRRLRIAAPSLTIGARANPRDPSR